MAATFSKGVVIPELVFVAFQATFAAITCALILGAVAERMKFSAVLVFMTLWFTFSYIPIAHMVWFWMGPDAYTDPSVVDAMNAKAGLIWQWGALDFAGGTVVHISSGCSALVCALYLGKRAGYPKMPFMPHNLVLSVIGACMLWVGWFGFNAGSALASNTIATNAFVTTHFAAASAALAWLAIEWIRLGKPTVLGGISGAVAGLAGVTQTAGFVTPMSALIIGAIAGTLCFFAVTEMKKKLGYDDSLDAFGVHGISGFTGAILVGIFASKTVNPIFTDKTTGTALPSGLLEGNSQQLMNQMVGILIAVALSVIGTYALLLIVEKLVGLRVSDDEEIQGLDLTQHGEDGYNFDYDVTSGTVSGMNFGAATKAIHHADRVTE